MLRRQSPEKLNRPCSARSSSKMFKWGRAQWRSWRLLLKHLNTRQRISVLAWRSFTTTSPAGNRYRIRCGLWAELGRGHLTLDAEEGWIDFCIHPEWWVKLPHADIMLSLKLMVEGAEMYVLDTAHPICAP